jgi:hypothetical protein
MELGYTWTDTGSRGRMGASPKWSSPYVAFTMFSAVPDWDPVACDHVPDDSVHVLPPKETELMW